MRPDLLLGAIGAIELLLALLPLAVLTAIAVVALRPAGERTIAKWAAAHQVTLSDRSTPLVARYLTRARRWRTLGTVAGIVVPTLMTVTGSPRPGFWQAVLVGYLLGAALAELTRPDPAGATRTATLVPRRLEDYIARSAVTWVRALAVASVVAAVMRMVVPLDARWRDDAPTVGTFVIAALACIAVAIVTEAAARRIVARPQRFEAADMLAADDAIRSASVHTVVGAGLALLLLVVGNQFLQVGVSTDPQLLRWTLPWVGIACTIGSIGAWLSTAHPRHWRVTRGATEALAL